MPGLLLDIAVPDIAAGTAFSTAALGLRVGRRFDPGFIELPGADAPIDLLEKAPDIAIGRRVATSSLRSPLVADPFGHGFCLIAFHEAGYDALLAPGGRTA